MAPTSVRQMTPRTQGQPASAAAAASLRVASSRVPGDNVATAPPTLDSAAPSLAGRIHSIVSIAHSIPPLLAGGLAGLVLLGVTILLMMPESKGHARLGQKVGVVSPFLASGRYVGHSRVKAGTLGEVVRSARNGKTLVRFDGFPGLFKVGDAEANHLEW